MLPDRARCLRLLETAGCEPAVIEHVQAVERLASRMAQHSPMADPAIVQAGALLHDVGRGFDHDVDHVIEGIGFLQAQGVDPRVVACVARHMGAGIREEQAQAWGWPQDRSYVPERIEERIVAHADNLTAGTGYRTLEAVVASLEAKGLEEVVPDVRRLHDGLEAALGIDPDEIARSLEREDQPASG